MSLLEVLGKVSLIPGCFHGGRVSRGRVSGAEGGSSWPLVPYPFWGWGILVPSHFQGVTPPPPLEWRPLLHSVRILLECFLVLRLQFDFSFDIATFKGNSCVCDTVKFDHVLDQFSNVSAEALSECGTVQSLHSI